MGLGKEKSQSQNPSLPITIIQTPNVNNISNYHNYNISNMTFNQEFGSGDSSRYQGAILNESQINSNP